MMRRFSILLLTGLIIGLVGTGCDQGTQTLAPDDANRYIISAKTSAVGDASDVNPRSSAQEVIVPDTVAYAVQGFATNKDYTWTVNDSDVPMETRSDETYVWEKRKGEFVTMVFAQRDPMTNVSRSDATNNTLSVNAADDNINEETIDIATVVPSVAGQLGRLGTYSTAASLAASAGLAATLDASGPYTLFVPRNGVLSALPTTPTQATDPDEPASSSVRADLLKYHTLTSTVATDDISDGMTAQTMLGDQTVSVGVSDGTVSVEGEADVVRANFPATNGLMHGIDGVLLPSTASVDFTDRTTDGLGAGAAVTVDGSLIPEDGGFIVLHDSTALADQGAIPSTVGVSEYIEPNTVANDVEVVLDEDVSSTTTIGAMPHRDSNDNQSYDFATTGGTEDSPYRLEGAPVIDHAVFTVE